MNNYEFYEVALNNISLFFSILIFSVFLHYFVFRSQVKLSINHLEHYY